MKTFNELREATSGRKGVECSAKKSQFGGYTPTCMRGNKLVYSAQQSYKDETTAKKHAEVYADAYYSMGDRAAQNATRKFVSQNKDKLYTKKESVEEGYKSPAEAQAIADGKKAARQGKKYEDNPHKKGSKEFTAWSKGHNMARESVEKEGYKAPTAAEIEADKKKDRRGKSKASATYKSLKNRMYKNVMGGLKDD
jgi:hypothetical protein